MTPIERIQEMESHLKVYQGLIEELEEIGRAHV